MILGADNVGMAKPKKPQDMLRLLQHFIKHSNQIEQIHSLLTTSGHLLFTSQWMNTVLYNTLIRAYLNITQPKTALILFTHMLFDQAQPNSNTFPSLSKAASSFPPRLASYIGKNLHCQVLKRGVLGDPYVCTSFIGLYSHAGELGTARKVFDEIPQPCVVSYNAMLDACGRNGDMDLGFLLFSRMPYRDVYSWTSMIHGYRKNGCSLVAVKFFQRMMVDEDVKCGLLKPNEATFVSILSCCTFLDVGVALDLGRQVHAYIVTNEELSVFTTTTLITFYGKMGCLVYAWKIFNALVSKPVCAWNAMISCLALNGREKQALAMYEQMRAKGLQPNEITFVAVLSACARAKLVDLGLKLFEAMSHEFGLIAKMEHYGCVVDLLGRGGLLQEAYAFIKKMPFEADAAAFGALLGACRLHGAVELGNEVAQLFLQSQLKQSGRYVQLSSIYLAALRKGMLDAETHKVPSHSGDDILSSLMTEF